MDNLKIIVGILAILLGWGYLFRKKFIFWINEWMRNTIFSDRLVLFSGRRLSFLLFLLGAISLFSGVSKLIDIKTIQPNIAAQMMAESKKTLTEKNYGRAIRLSRELLRSEPKNIQAWEVLAISAWAIGEKRIAFHSIDSIIQIDPTSETLTGSLKAIFEQRFNKNGTKS